MTDSCALLPAAFISIFSDGSPARFFRPTSASGLHVHIVAYSGGERQRGEAEGGGQRGEAEGGANGAW